MISEAGIPASFFLTSNELLPPDLNHAPAIRSGLGGQFVPRGFGRHRLLDHWQYRLAGS